MKTLIVVSISLLKHKVLLIKNLKKKLALLPKPSINQNFNFYLIWNIIFNCFLILLKKRTQTKRKINK